MAGGQLPPVPSILPLSGPPPVVRMTMLCALVLLSALVRQVECSFATWRIESYDPRSIGHSMDFYLLGHIAPEHSPALTISLPTYDISRPAVTAKI